MRSLILVVVSVFVAPLAGLVLAGQQGVSPSMTGNQFSRMFHLPAFAPPTDHVRAALTEIGRKGGIMDAHDDVTAGPIPLITDPSLRANNPDSIGHTAGVTFFGQFLDHDMTFDSVSRLGRPTDPHTTPNARRPFFDLDSVYGDGPAASSILYDPSDPAKLRVEHGGIFEDLPRDGSGRAIIADPRNDENVIIAGLQVAFLMFHNAMVDRVRSAEPELSPEDVFDEARRLTVMHYQWLIRYEFLPQFIDPAIMKEVLTAGGRYYPTSQTGLTIPVEFQIAYRFGHSLVRPSYRVNFTGNGGAPFFAMLFEPQNGTGEPSDMRGGARANRRFVGWQTFFLFTGFGDDMRRNKRLDTKLSTPLFDLPLGAIASGTPPTSLAERNLYRHLTWQLPSGQAIARAMGVAAIDPAQLADIGAIYRPFATSTPLWFYVLREADLAGGDQLGAVGGRILAEVFLGLLRADPASIVNQPFVPTLGSTAGQFTMVDFLRIAGVDQKR